MFTVYDILNFKCRGSKPTRATFGCTVLKQKGRFLFTVCCLWVVLYCTYCCSPPPLLIFVSLCTLSLSKNRPYGLQHYSISSECTCHILKQLKSHKFPVAFVLVCRDSDNFWDSVQFEMIFLSKGYRSSPILNNQSIIPTFIPSQELSPEGFYNGTELDEAADNYRHIWRKI